VNSIVSDGAAEERDRACFQFFEGRPPFVFTSGFLFAYSNKYGRVSAANLLTPPSVCFIIKKGRMNQNLNIMVIGGGAREHAIIKKLKFSAKIDEIIALPGNGGIARDVQCVDADPFNISAVINECKKRKIDYVVVTPDDPLALGMVDELSEAGIRSFGPVKAAAMLESSKIFAKNLMKKYNIPTAACEIFTESAVAVNYARQCFKSGKKAVVVKADGLALGKGVAVCGCVKEAEEAICNAMEKKVFGKSGERIIIEECLTGPEVSVLSFCDGRIVAPMISSMDHKRSLDGDLGPNTGGMGCIAPNPFYTPEIAEICARDIFSPTIKAIAKEAAPFKGCLYFGLMLTADGPKVIEYNCRFGDPETQAVLPLLETDLFSIMTACTDGALSPDMVRFRAGASACVVAASQGYPGPYEKGFLIEGLEDAEAGGAVVYCAGVKQEEAGLASCGGRVLSVSATAPSLEGAVESAYSGIKKISFQNKYFRTDIGASALQVLKKSPAL
jgi:phosphoribosylamine--glycine ligase